MKIKDVYKLVKKAVEDLKLGVEVKLEDSSATTDEEEFSVMVDEYLEIILTKIETKTIAGVRESDGFALIEWSQTGGSYWEPPDVEEHEITSGSVAHVIQELCRLIVTRPVDNYFEMYDVYLEQELELAEDSIINEDPRL